MATYTYSLDVRFSVSRHKGLSFMSKLLELGPTDGDCLITQDTDHIYAKFAFMDATFDWRLYARIEKLHSAFEELFETWQYRLLAFDGCYGTNIAPAVASFSSHVSTYRFFEDLTDTVDGIEAIDF